MKDPCPIDVGSETEEPLPGPDNASEGLMMTVGVVLGPATESDGLTTIPTPLGASRIGITSKLGWKYRRARMNELPPDRRIRVKSRDSIESRRPALS